MERAIILAAGRGERLVNGKAYPKPLETVNGVPLIVRVLRNLERAGVEEVGIIVGYLGDVLIRGLSEYRFDIDIRFFWNHRYDKPNGTSLLAAREMVTGPTFLMMSDHLWSPELIQRVRRYPLASDEAVLGIDFKIAECIDLDDATKVAIRGDRVMKIGKTIPHYDGRDRSARRGGGAGRLLAVAGHRPTRERRPHARGRRGRGYVGRRRHAAGPSSRRDALARLRVSVAAEPAHDDGSRVSGASGRVIFARVRPGGGTRSRRAGCGATFAVPVAL
jgi:1L-myo-inositol 1-phosphate cytidylyltransferase